MPLPHGHKRIRLIDTISETEDSIPVPQEWEWLMTPFILALDMPSSAVVSENLYVDVKGGNAQIIYPKDLVHIAGTLDEDEKAKTTLDFLMPLSGTIVILGDPGVGKTTWIQHFFKLPEISDANEAFYLDGRDVCSPLVDLPPDEYLKAKIREGMIKTAQKVCRRLGLPHKINNISEPAAVAHSIGIESIVNSAAQECMKNGVQLWLILDNFDRRERKLQDEAINFARNALVHWGIRSIVPIRPYTMEGRRLDDLQCVTLQPPSLNALLHKRADYAINSPAASQIINQLERGTVNLSWTQGNIDSKDKLLALYKNVGTALSESTEFIQFLSAVHAHDLHYILYELKDLCNSGYFCAVMIEQLSHLSRNAHTHISRHELIRAYMRGHYYHHRAEHQSGKSIVNLFDAGADTKHRFLAIRILQLADRYGHGVLDSVPVKVLTDKLVSFGFITEYISSEIEHLVRCRLLIETTRFADWDTADFKLNQSDKVKLTFTGKYYIENLLKNTRYIESMAHVTRLPPSTIAEMPTRTRTTEDSFKNIYFLLKDVGETILQNLEDMRKSHVLSDFLREINHQPGFFYLAVDECLRRVEDIHNENRLSIDVVNNFKELSQMAHNIINIKDKISDYK
jgi:hypothetical protein